MNDWIDLDALWQIVVFGLLAGAGLPALFAVGLRALSMPGKGMAPAGPDSDRVVGGNPVGMVIAVVCFIIVLAAVAGGIFFIVHG